MDFKDSIQQLAQRIDSLKQNLPTEEATKNALIMPFISALGYDVFNPLEVLPEMTCDIGTKKGEKIDYAILRNNEPIILIECKHWAQNLNLHDNQLLRYFNVSKAKFGLLTNGIIYRFYTDLVSPNKMDEKPFLEVNMLDLKDSQIEELKKFHKSYFDIDNILSSASELKYMSELKSALAREFTNPSTEFVKFLGKQVYDGLFTQKVADQFTSIVKRAVSSYINDLISDRLKAVIKDSEEPVSQDTNEIKDVEIKPEVKRSESKVVTTDEEIEAFYIVKSMIRNIVPTDKITYRDAQSYFAILFDNNNRKPICRLYLNSSSNKKIVFLDDEHKEVPHKIESIEDIYNYESELIASVKRYI